MVDNNIEKVNGDGTSAWLNALSTTVGLPLVLDVEGGIGGVAKTTFVRGRAPTAELAHEAITKVSLCIVEKSVSHRRALALEEGK